MKKTVAYLLPYIEAEKDAGAGCASERPKHRFRLLRFGGLGNLGGLGSLGSPGLGGLGGFRFGGLGGFGGRSLTQLLNAVVGVDDPGEVLLWVNYSSAGGGVARVQEREQLDECP